MANQIVASVYQIDGNPQGRGEPQNNFVLATFPTSQILMFDATLSTISYVNTAIQFYNNPLQPNQYQTFYVSETLTELVAAANVGGTTQSELRVREIDNNPLGAGDDGDTFPHYSFPSFVLSTIVNNDGYAVISFKGKLYLFDGDANDIIISANSGDYKVYTALLSQTGTDAPVATVLQNTLGGTPAWSYNNTGDFAVTLADAFPLDKTVFFITPTYFPEPTFTAALQSSSEIAVRTTSDGTLDNTPFEIRVFP